MGYILPLQHNQYTDYQNRVIEEKKDRMFIEGPFKAILESKYEEANQTDINEYELLKNEAQFEQEYDKKPNKPYVSNNIIAEITGKGFMFNDKI